MLEHFPAPPRATRATSIGWSGWSRCLVGVWFIAAEAMFFWLILRFRKRDGVQGAVHHRQGEAPQALDQHPAHARS